MWLIFFTLACKHYCQNGFHDPSSVAQDVGLKNQIAFKRAKFIFDLNGGIWTLWYLDLFFLLWKCKPSN